ncbi:hypothetical protein BDK51DRAFT_42479 [Blyttiomyces helicus]|uniref:Uncharacterized protein n=1 Tax=Blyttiomyces helicus TaxID=388810 RepID=A0A4P9WLH8_9FUNG|nr:hypothetical protein BDK51DRAFT_42479 [Blyttiomyces helicus]|eukprot:RKO93272.1 hypothetical protein BDK51DRAFT_42479 [Blyttiomyces helicus]
MAGMDRLPARRQAETWRASQGHLGPHPSLLLPLPFPRGQAWSCGVSAAKPHDDGLEERGIIVLSAETVRVNSSSLSVKIKLHVLRCLRLLRGPVSSPGPVKIKLYFFRCGTSAQTSIKYPTLVRSSLLPSTSQQTLKTYRKTPAAAASLPDAAERACAAYQKSLMRSTRRTSVNAAILSCAQSQAPSPAPDASGMARIPLTWATVPYDVLRRALGWVEPFSPRQRHSTLVSCPRVCKAWSITETEAIRWNVVVGGKLDQVGRLVELPHSSSRLGTFTQLPTGSLLRALGIDVHMPGAIQTISQTLEFLYLSTVALCPNLRYLGIGYTGSVAPLLSVLTLAIIFQSCTQLACFHFRGDIYDHDPVGTEEFWNADPMGRAIIEGVNGLKYLLFCSSSGEIDDAIDRATGPKLLGWYTSWGAYAEIQVAENSPDLMVPIAADDCHLAKIEAVAPGCHLLGARLRVREEEKTEKGLADLACLGANRQE